MFISSDPAEVDDFISSTSSAELLDYARMQMRTENRCSAAKVIAASHIAAHKLREIIALGSDAPHPKVGSWAQKAALGEVSLQFGISRTLAGEWITLGDMLAELDIIRLAYLDGEFAFSRARILAAKLSTCPDHAKDTAQHSALDLARRATTNTVLGDDLDALLIDIDPDNAAENREDFTEQQDVRIGRSHHGHGQVDATVPATTASHLASRIDALVAAVCPTDPRSIGQLRAAAFAVAIGERAAMRCLCGSPDCPLAPQPPAAPQPSTPAKPLVTIVTDLPTLAGVNSGFASFIEGFGVIDPALVRDLAADATWQGLYRDAISAAAAHDGTEGVRRGRPRRPGHIVTDPDPPPFDPTGHGGHHQPPPGALHYHASERLRKHIELTDRYCRYPFCSKPVRDCQLDHLVPFNHTDPHVGGWTVAMNLAPLCTADHQRKTAGLWLPTMHADRRITWRDPQNGQTIVTYPSSRQPTGTS